MATNGCDKACGSLFCAMNSTDYLLSSPGMPCDPVIGRCVKKKSGSSLSNIATNGSKACASLFFAMNTSDYLDPYRPQEAVR
ncbi:hypothetical protein T4E_7843 [Trichinella pseudospiralis]|uniref:Uncharacterized protein n=1 Tax=Trichinella pseudospiralis TaxID=6337 RepID=A0A0V0YD13_TRIPS|nr:hypothetical protein T4E_7843 [Trichinella pseudospiralis]